LHQTTELDVLDGCALRLVRPWVRLCPCALGCAYAYLCMRSRFRAEDTLKCVQ
jgi:hypothetical protein